MAGLDRSRTQNPAALTVSQLVSRIKVVVEPPFRSVLVMGEVSAISVSKGHHYFTLKDAHSQIKCVCWASNIARLKFQLKLGLEVIVAGAIDLFIPHGDFKLQAQSIEPVGIGAAELALRQLKDKLLALGYFSPERKRPLPRFPRRIAIVTSATGAAIRDILETLRQRWPIAKVVVRGCKVQGDNAAHEIALALRHLGKLHANRMLPFDVIILGRGGGGQDDLAAFNEEIVAEAIVQSPIPVITGVGHEINLTIADLVADEWAETPTAAATKCTPNLPQLQNDVQNCLEQLTAAMEQYLRDRQLDVKRIADRPAFRRPLDRLRELQRRLTDQHRRLTRQMTANLERASAQLAAVSGRLESLSPLNVLTRGYSLTMHDGRIVKRSSDVKPGDELSTRLSTGTINSTVTSIG